MPRLTVAEIDERIDRHAERLNQSRDMWDAYEPAWTLFAYGLMREEAAATTTCPECGAPGYPVEAMTYEKHLRQMAREDSEF